MSRNTTRRHGRLRAIAVAGALAVSMLGGVAAPAMAAVPPAHANGQSGHAPGIIMNHDVREQATAHLADEAEHADDGGVSTQGWSWF
jgi:hypothetical protein